MTTIQIGSTRFEAKLETLNHDSLWDDRESIAITIAMDYDTANDIFIDDLKWDTVSIAGVDEDGVEHELITPMSDYVLAGPIIDHRDGTLTIHMGKYTEQELLEIPLPATPIDHNEAAVWKSAIESAIQYVDDKTALDILPLYPLWTDLAAEGWIAENAGFKFTHEGKLYKTINPNSTFAETWVPGVGTESLYTCINETNSGDTTDPIPYDGNMELIEGNYYTQNDVVYHCIRSTGAPVHHALADLVGMYVEVVA